MRRIIITAMAMVLLGTIMAFALPSEDKANQGRGERIGQLREEISAINLVNGLNLSEEQLTQTIGLLREVEKTRAEMKTQSAEAAEETVKSFEELRKALENGPNLPPAIAQRAGMNNEKAKTLQEELQKKMMEYDNRLEDLLTESQKCVIEDFKPCLLPPQNQRNPVRVGQSRTNDAAIGHMRRLREVPQKVYDEKKEKILNEYFNKFEEKHGKMPDGEKAKERQRLFGLADKVRAMTPEEFEMNKNSLAEEFIIKDKFEELQKQLKELMDYRHKNKQEIGKAGRFFFRPEMLPIVENRLASLKNFTPASPADLDKISSSQAPETGRTK